jgi:hypothetical protein
MHTPLGVLLAVRSCATIEIPDIAKIMRPAAARAARNNPNTRTQT